MYLKLSVSAEKASIEDNKSATERAQSDSSGRTREDKPGTKQRTRPCPVDGNRPKHISRPRRQARPSADVNEYPVDDLSDGRCSAWCNDPKRLGEAARQMQRRQAAGEKAAPTLTGKSDMVMRWSELGAQPEIPAKSSLPLFGRPI